MNVATNTLMAGLFAICTAVFWGTYGPLLQRGHQYMETGGRMRPFICVGFAYLLVAIIGPIVVMYAFGIDKGDGIFTGWKFRGIVWSTIAGAVGALGAFTLLMALGAGGPTSPLYVMPMVFGCAPVVSTLTTMYINNTYKQMSPFFAAGLILVAAGAITILITAPKGKGHAPSSGHSAKAEPAKVTPEKPAGQKPTAEKPLAEPKPQAADKDWTDPKAT
jgi:hypothetical protein